ncbi:hypothetical protein SAMN05216298_0431 [Glycomyces sambucus]|uniref:DUF1963 domain-containing protein n=1 Tax=Glycomyces sambucus TaxID=380244 RepID=A0A1G9CN51_9ACTN|nr:hypothetical protein [Glycomyces sambucus]SDK53121.1 hypothetical protein SAMN05216298_0431 [Glycomyces sambucus]
MDLTTPPRPFDLLGDFPELSAYARPAVRLHPRRGEPTVAQSSIGGPLLWPADEAWPLCYLDHDDTSIEPYDAALRLRHQEGKIEGMRGRTGYLDFTAQMEHRRTLASSLVDAAGIAYGADEPRPLIPVAQMYSCDVPGLPFTDRFDLLQILWCPRDHVNTRNLAPHCPAFQVRWSRADPTAALVTDPPEPDLCNGEYLPAPCILYPEVVTEYPDMRNLPEPLEHALRGWHRDEDEDEEEWSTAYSFDTALAPGWKAMGHGMYWGIIDPFPVVCECGAEQLPLFTADSSEFDGGTGSWRPVEEAGSGGLLQNPVGVTIGRAYTLQLYFCPESETHPCRSVMS